MLLFGFDPGGVKSFGWAVLGLSTRGKVEGLRTGVVSNAPEPVESVRRAAASPPAAVGIDAPLFWTQKGDRAADAYLRRRVTAAGGAGGTVGSVNSLRGACLVQGILTARLVAASWPDAFITEAHPKALLLLSSGAHQFWEEHVSQSSQNHERDAALAAFAAWAAATSRPGWRNLVEAEPDVVFPTGKAVTYWFPDVRD